MTAGPILFFDSGIGGLSVVDATRALLPDALFVYVADNAGAPYGPRGEGEITVRVSALLGRVVERFAPSLVVIACNTASTIALATVRAALDVPVVGTVPAIKPAAEASRSRTIGVLGTEATVRQPYVDRLSAEFAADCRVLRHGAPALVTLAEAKLRGDPVAPAAVAVAVAPLFAQAGGEAIDTVVLACTHFPLLAQELRVAVGGGIAFVDGSAGIARRVAHLARGFEWRTAASNVAVVTRLDDDARRLTDAFQRRGFDCPAAL